MVKRSEFPSYIESTKVDKNTMYIENREAKFYACFYFSLCLFSNLDARWSHEKSDFRKAIDGREIWSEKLK